jgi:hypothetical protein
MDKYCIGNKNVWILDQETRRKSNSVRQAELGLVLFIQGFIYYTQCKIVNRDSLLTPKMNYNLIYKYAIDYQAVLELDWPII